jgi:lipid-A-disaccharide synthase
VKPLLRPRVFVSAGEASGDRILGDILRLLREGLPDLELRGLGGEAAAGCGLKPLFPLERTAFSGAWDVIRNAAFALRMYASAARELRRFRPDLVLLVDYPGLNLRLARLARNLGVPVCFVAPPQAWAYRNPARKLKRANGALKGCHVHVLFPFEKASFQDAAAGVSVGHFLGGEPGAMRGPLAAGRDAPGKTGLLLLCPGSRVAVLRRNLPAWLDTLAAADRLAGDIAVLVPKALAPIAERILAVHANGRYAGRARVRSDKAAAFAEAGRAIAFPGTITLELALARVPTLVLAVLDPLTYALGRRILRDTRLALPNLILGGEAFPEWAGTGKGPNPERYLELERLREGASGAGTLPERLAGRLGPGAGAEEAYAVCARILRGSGTDRNAEDTLKTPHETAKSG